MEADRRERCGRWRCAVVLVCALQLAGSAAFAGGSASEAYLEPGPFGVGHRGSLAADDTDRMRSFHFEMWYPTDAPPLPEDRLVVQEDAPLTSSAGPHPLVLYSHGFSSFSNEGSFLAGHLATHGYVVAAPAFPFTGFGTPGGPQFFDVVNQPGDVSFVIDLMLSWSADPKSFLHQRIDVERIGVAGLSLGGMTTLLTAFHRDLRDPRIKAAAPMAAVASLFGDAFYGFADVPLMLLAADRDAIVSYRDSGLPAFERANAPKFLATFLAGSHTGWSSTALAIFEDENNPDEIGCGFLFNPASAEPVDEEGTAGAPDLVELLGGESAGILDDVGGLSACTGELAGFLPLRSMRPSRQHVLTVLAVRSFLDLHLFGDETRAVATESFLSSSLDDENDDLLLCRDGATCVPEPGALAGTLAVLIAMGLVARRQPPGRYQTGDVHARS